MNNQKEKTEALEHSEVLLLIVNVLENVEVELFNGLVQSDFSAFQRRKLKLLRLLLFSALLSYMAIGRWLSHALFGTEHWSWVVCMCIQERIWVTSDYRCPWVCVKVTVLVFRCHILFLLDQTLSLWPSRFWSLKVQWMRCWNDLFFNKVSICRLFLGTLNLVDVIFWSESDWSELWLGFSLVDAGYPPPPWVIASLAILWWFSDNLLRWEHSLRLPAREIVRNVLSVEISSAL